MSLCSRGSEVLTDYIRGSRLHAPKVMEWGSELDLLRLLPLHHHRGRTQVAQEKSKQWSFSPGGWRKWMGAGRDPLSSPQPPTLGSSGTLSHGRQAGKEGWEVLTAMPWPKPEPGCGLAALM